MEPIVRKHDPVRGIGLLEVFEAYYDEQGMMIFPAKIDGRDFSFFLNDDRLWEIKEVGELSWVVIDLVGDMIEKKAS
nr:hypothetical protein [Mucilaginibacter sp. L294]